MWVEEMGPARDVPSDFRDHIPGLEEDDDDLGFPDDDVDDIPYAPPSRTGSPGAMLPKALAAAVLLLLVGGAVSLLGGGSGDQLSGEEASGDELVAAVASPAPAAPAVTKTPRAEARPQVKQEPVQMDGPDAAPPVNDSPPETNDDGTAVALDAAAAAQAEAQAAEMTAQARADEQAAAAARQREAEERVRAQAKAARERARAAAAPKPPIESRVRPPPDPPKAAAPASGGVDSLWLAGSGGGAPAAVDGTVTIESIPSGATVWVDGKKKGVAPIGLSLAPGDHDFKVGMDGYKESRRRYAVQAGASVSIPFQLEPTNTKVAVLLVGPPDMAGARVYLRGKELGSIPVSTEIRAGVHEFQVVGTDRFYKVRRDVAPGGDGRAVKVDLNPQ